ncbi:hypothetical protein [Candidatus Frankia nodulisporulans]|uniref:hypothetical protein n=1 Tax=Candidatus Frankia nodulisporulans TaxID=2060052 RepID=UPI001CDC9026|nr:hypothetical protein [Candidatus Frankia nodulisporulans]
MSSSADDRKKIVEYLGRQLVGPVNGENEVLLEEPAGRYLCGILYPQSDTPTNDGESGPPTDSGDSDVQDEQGGQFGDEIDEDPMVLAGQNKPSSIGLSFMIDSWSPIVVELNARAVCRR